MDPKRGPTLKSGELKTLPKSRKNGLKKSLVFGIHFLIDCYGFLKDFREIWEGLGAHFSVKFSSHRENVDFVKIIVFLKENCYFSRSGLPKIVKNCDKIDAKCNVKN